MSSIVGLSGLRPTLEIIKHTKKIAIELQSHPIDVSIIEKVHAMPRQGVTSSFQFGRNFGGIETLSYLFSKRVDYVAPAIWKKSLGLGSSKKESLDLARLKFGNSDLWNVKSNDGIAEAALLTLYWIEKFNSCLLYTSDAADE